MRSSQVMSPSPIRHSVVAPTLAVSLLSRSTVGSGTLDVLVTVALVYLLTILKYMAHFMFETFSVPDMYVSVQAGLSVCFETHNGIRDGIVRRCVAHHVRSLLLLARSSLYVRDGTQIKRGVSTLKYSIAHDFVMTWDDLENIRHHTFSCDFWVVPMQEAGFEA